MEDIPVSLVQPLINIINARKKVYNANSELRESIITFNRINAKLFDNGMIGDCRILTHDGNSAIVVIIDEDGEFHEFEKLGIDFQLKVNNLGVSNHDSNTSDN